MDGFENLSASSSQTVSEEQVGMTKKRKLTPRQKKVFLWGGGVLLALILFIIVGIIIPGVKAASDAKKVYAKAKETVALLKQQNIAVASDAVAATKSDLTVLEGDIDNMGYLRFVPLVNWYYNDASHLVKAGQDSLDALQITIDSIKPYADVLGLKGQGSFVGGSAQQRIETAIRTMGKITPRIDDIVARLANAQEELDQVDENHYPGVFGGEKIKKNLTMIKTLADQGISFSTQARPLIKVLPEMLGEPTQKKYLIIFQNDKELRPTGGFMTAYAIFRVEHGVIHVDTSSDIYTLDATVPNKPSAPRPILTYLPKVPQLNLRDTNLSPDYLTSMKLFNSLYKTAGGYQPVDGVIAIDTHVLVSAMNILGDIQVNGQTFSTKIDPRCSCPQVIYEMEVYADQPVQFIKANRKGIIGDLMYAIMDKAFSSSPKLYWGPLFQAMITDIQEKHILFSLNNENAQTGMLALNAVGEIKAFQGDYLHINEANFGGAKSNMYVQEKVSQSYEVKGDGSIVKTVTINYKNPFAPSDCNLEHGKLCLNAILRDWVRVYVPQGSQLISSKGSEVKMTSYTELGKTVFEGFLTVRPLGIATLTLTYQLPFKVSSDRSLPLLIQKQPGTDNNMYDIQAKNTIQPFPLLTDKILTLTLP